MKNVRRINISVSEEVFACYQISVPIGSDCQESSSLWEWDAHKEGAFYDGFFVVGIGYLHQVAAIGTTLLAIVLHVAISVMQARQHGILDRSLASGVCKIASYAFDSRDFVNAIVCI